MYDYAAALLQAGRPDEAVQILEARLARFDNQNGTVRDLLKQARKASRGNYARQRRGCTTFLHPLRSFVVHPRRSRLVRRASASSAPA